MPAGRGRKNAMTVQEMVEDAIARSTGVKTAIVGAGRTDAGVHALGQVAHLTLRPIFLRTSFPMSSTWCCQDDIRIQESRRVRTTSTPEGTP